jgi:alpha-aminoadipate carrier protein LysW
MINPQNPALQNAHNKPKCPDCNYELTIPNDMEKGEIITCLCCGLELEVKKTNVGGGCLDLQELTIEGDDWGE